MNKRKITIKFIILLILFGSVFAHCIYYVTNLKQNFKTVSVRLTDEPVTREDIDRIIENEEELGSEHIPQITGFHMEEHFKVYEPDLKKEEVATLIKVYGQMEDVFPVQLICGNYVYVDDRFGCVLDQKTAYTLFGGYDIVGKVVQIDKKDYFIRGIVQSKVPVVMIQTKDSKEKFYHLQFNYGGLKQGRVYTENYLMSYLYTKKAVIIDQQMFGTILTNVVWLPMFFIFLSVVISSIGECYSVYMSQHRRLAGQLYIPKGEKRKAIFSVILQWIYPLLKMVVAFLPFFFLIKKFGALPLSYLPTKWSDFNQYVRMYHSITHRIKEMNYVSQTYREVQLRFDMYVAIADLIIEVSLLWHIKDVIATLKKIEDDEYKKIATTVVKSKKPKKHKKSKPKNDNEEQKSLSMSETSENVDSTDEKSEVDNKA